MGPSSMRRRAPVKFCWKNSTFFLRMYRPRELGEMILAWAVSELGSRSESMSLRFVAYGPRRQGFATPPCWRAAAFPATQITLRYARGSNPRERG